MVGTNWACVTWWCSMAASACSASNRFIMTTVPPRDWIAPHHRSGAAWYINVRGAIGDDKIAVAGICRGFGNRLREGRPENGAEEFNACRVMVTGSESAIPTPMPSTPPGSVILRFAEPFALLSNNSFGALCVL